MDHKPVRKTGYIKTSTPETVVIYEYLKGVLEPDGEYVKFTEGSTDHSVAEALVAAGKVRSGIKAIHIAGTRRELFGNFRPKPPAPPKPEPPATESVNAGRIDALMEAVGQLQVKVDEHDRVRATSAKNGAILRDDVQAILAYLTRIDPDWRQKQ